MSVQNTPTGRLLEEFRDLVTQTANAEGSEKVALSKKADGHEEEIMRRMSW